MEEFALVVSQVDAWIWGIPMIAILTICHFFCTWRTGFIQVMIPKAIKLSFTKDPNAEGDISQFGALCTSLSGTLGVGCIVGVATAVISGGPGAILWMWIMGILGIATKYSETYIAVKYRVKDKKGDMIGGAMYVWERAFAKNKTKEDPIGVVPKWAKFGGICFAIFTAIATLGTGSAIQASAISTSIVYYFPFIPQWSIAVVICIVTAFTIFGGVKAISKVCEKLVPFMTVAYLLGTVILLVINWEFFCPAISLICECAFTPKAAFGGAVGSSIGVAMQFGIARGLFSNESGLGTAPIVASAAATKNPARQSLVAMTGAFWSTVVICAITGIVLVSSIMANPELANSDSQILTMQAFEQIPYVGGPILGFSIAMFAFSTIIGWSYYANRSIMYLFGRKFVQPFLVLYLIAAFVGGAGFGGIIWSISDITNALMAIPNVLVVVLLSKLIGKDTHDYVWEKNLDQASDDVVITVDK